MRRLKLYEEKGNEEFIKTLDNIPLGTSTSHTNEERLAKLFLIANAEFKDDKDNAIYFYIAGIAYLLGRNNIPHHITDDMTLSLDKVCEVLSIHGNSLLYIENWSKEQLNSLDTVMSNIRLVMTDIEVVF